ncbi:MAG: TRAP transporter fused permease subunit [Chloroflexota bacterium]|nr:TRAP transporter fused permease subunit [Chloroflexota bacterium]
MLEAEAPLEEARAQQIIEEYESESPTRALEGAWRIAVSVLAVGLSVYALYWTQYSIATQAYRAGFLMVALVLTFLLYPVRGRRAWLEFVAVLLGGGLLFGLYWTGDVRPPAQARFLADLGQPAVLGPVAALAIAVALYGVARRGRRWGAVPPYDVVLACLAVLCLTFLIQNYVAALQRIINPTPTEVVMGILLIALVLEATRRTTGWILPAVTLGFLIYAYLGPFVPPPFDHRGYRVQRIVGQNFLTLEGVFGVPLDVAATFIILFTIYGAVLEYSGAGKFFLDWSFAALGRSRSGAGPGRTATAAGFLLGTVSGSGVATTVTLGSLAWPMLRRGGYDRDTAGAILAAAGIGALLSPPTLGAAAFLIAEYLRISYLQVLIMATIPTLLYYLSCLLMIEADSRRLQTREVQVESMPLLELTAKYGYHFTSLFAVAVLMATGMTPFMAVFWSIAIAFSLSFLRPETRLTSLWAAGAGLLLAAALLLLLGFAAPRAAFWGMMLTAGVATVQTVLRALGVRLPLPGLRVPRPEDFRFLAALESGGRGVLSVAATTATAGVIVSVVTLTGLGLKISGIIVALSGGLPLLTVLYAAIAVWVLGLAVPVTASYIIAAVMIVPALKAVGVLEPAAHMFVFYYAVLADVSPPTALSPFASAAITGGNPFRTMMLTWKYCLPAFLVPFMFTLNKEGASLLLVGERGVLTADPLTVAWTLVTSCLAVGALAVALGGWFFGRAGITERVLIGAGGLALLYASLTTDAIGTALLLAGLAVHLFQRRRARATPTAAVLTPGA